MESHVPTLSLLRAHPDTMHQVKGETAKMTNQEWLDFIYPDNDELPYMYDGFDWGHCA